MALLTWFDTYYTGLALLTFIPLAAFLFFKSNRARFITTAVLAVCGTLIMLGNFGLILIGADGGTLGFIVWTINAFIWF